MRMMKSETGKAIILTCVALLFTFSVVKCELKEDTVTISTQLGSVTGNKVLIGNNYVYEFLGLRYAIPPLNDLRFRPTTIYDIPYNDTYDATKFNCGCLQYPPVYDFTIQNVFLDVLLLCISSCISFIQFFFH